MSNDKYRRLKLEWVKAGVSGIGRTMIELGISISTGATLGLITREGLEFFIPANSYMPTVGGILVGLAALSYVEYRFARSLPFLPKLGSGK